MKKSKSSLFMELLLSLSESQKNDLIHFIKMPGLGLPEGLEDLFGKILDDKTFTESEGRKLLEQQAVKSYSWEKVKQKMVDVIRRYLSMGMRDVNAFEKVRLMEYYASKGLTKNLKKALKNINVLQQNGVDFNTHLINYHIARINLISTKDKFEANEYLLLMEQQLDLYYLQNKLLCKTERLNRKNIVENDDWLGETLVELPEKVYKHAEESVGGTLYYYIYQMLGKSSPEKQRIWFNQIRSKLQKDVKLLNPDFVKDIYNQLLNYCNRALNRKNIQLAEVYEFAGLYLELIEELENKKLLASNGNIHIGYLHNIVTACLLTSNSLKARRYFDKFSPKIKSEQYQPLLTLLEGKMYAMEGKFDEVQTLLTKQSKLKSYHHFTDKKLYIQSYIESGDCTSALHEIASLRRNLSREGVMPEHRKQLIKNFLSFAKKLTDKLLEFSNSPAKGQKEIEKILIKDCSPTDLVWFEKFKERVAQNGLPDKIS